MTASERIEAMFQEATRATGAEYAALEQAISASGPDAEAVLTAHLADVDPVDRHLARMLLLAVRGQAAEHARMLTYLEKIPSFFSDLPNPTPRPDQVGAHMVERFGDSVADYAALRALKGSDWPYWKVASLIEYLRLLRRFSVTSVLLRLRTVGRDVRWQRAAARAIRETADPDLEEKIAFERARCAALGLPFEPFP